VFRIQHPYGATGFAPILLAARPMMAIFNNIRAAAFAALLYGWLHDHKTIIHASMILDKKIHSSFRRDHYPFLII